MQKQTVIQRMKGHQSVAGAGTLLRSARGRQRIRVGAAMATGKMSVGATTLPGATHSLNPHMTLCGQRDYPHFMTKKWMHSRLSPRLHRE